MRGLGHGHRHAAGGARRFRGQPDCWGAGDRADVLRALLAAGARDVVLAGIADRPATEAAYAAGVGGTVAVGIGATIDKAGSVPAQVRAEVVFLAEIAVPLERQAVLRVDRITLAVTARRRPFHTPAEAHYVTVAPHNPMGSLATAVNVHFSAATQNFRILEYRLPKGAVYIFGGTELEERKDTTNYVADPYLPKDGYLELRPDRPGWGVEMDEAAMMRDGYVHWQRKVPKRPDGSFAFA